MRPRPSRRGDCARRSRGGALPRRADRGRAAGHPARPQARTAVAVTNAEPAELEDDGEARRGGCDGDGSLVDGDPARAAQPRLHEQQIDGVSRSSHRCTTPTRWRFGKGVVFVAGFGGGSSTPGRHLRAPWRQGGADRPARRGRARLEERNATRPRGRGLRTRSITWSVSNGSRSPERGPRRSGSSPLTPTYGHGGGAPGDEGGLDRDAEALSARRSSSIRIWHVLIPLATVQMY